MRPSRWRAVPLFAALAVAACATQRAETWGFVATLGNDTTSVERVTRTGRRVSGEAVGRSPVVVRRRWEAEFDSAGSVRRWTMDSHRPNAAPGETDLHHELTVTGNRVRIIRQAGRDSVDRTVTIPYVRLVPWNAFLYATFDDLFQAARGLPDTARVGQYFFEGWEEGNFGYALVRQLPTGDASIGSTGLSGEGLAQFDERGRMRHYSGEGTTYRQEVRRITNVPDLAALLGRFAADERARGFSRWLSPRDTMRATIGATTIMVDYSRPLVRGRTLIGGLIPLGQVWRTGANAATQLMVSGSIRLAGVPLRAGTYTLWTLPRRDGVDLIINGQSGQWGTSYRSEHDIARRPMQVSALDTPVERFTIRIDGPGSALVMEWGTFRWSAPIQESR